MATAIKILNQGEDGYFLLKYKKPDGTYYDIDADFDKFQIYAYTDGVFIAKYDRDGDAGFIQMNRIDANTYQYWVRGEDNVQMTPGDLKLAVWTQTSEAALEDLFVDDMGEGVIYQLRPKLPFVS